MGSKSRPFARPALPASAVGGGMRRVSALLLGLTAFNAVTGYLREVVIALTYGASATTDAYFSAFALVMTLTDLLPGAALVTGFIPAIAPLVQGGVATLEARRRLVMSAGLAIFLGTGVLALLLWFLLPAALRLLIPGADPATLAVAIHLGRWLAWLLPLLPLLLLFTLVLNAHNHFVLAACAWPGINLAFIAVVALLGSRLGQAALIPGVLAGPALMTLVLGCRLAAMGFIGRLPRGGSNHDFRLFWKLSRPMLATLGLGSSTGLVMVAHLLLRRYGSDFGEGAISALGYAYRIYEVPVTLAANTAAVMILPAAAHLVAAGRRDEIAGLCRQLLIWGMILLLPAVAVAVIEADFIVDLLLRRGRFSLQDAALTATALRGFAPAILFEATFLVLYRVFYALHRPLVPVALSLLTLASLALLLVAAHGRASFPLLALCISASFAMTALALCLALWRWLGRSALPDAGALLRPLAAALVCAGLWWAVAHRLDSASYAVALLGMAGFGLAYAGLALAIMPRERAQLRTLLGRRAGPAPAPQG